MFLSPGDPGGRDPGGCGQGGRGGPPGGGGAYPRARGSRQASSPLQASHSLRAKEGGLGLGSYPARPSHDDPKPTPGRGETLVPPAPGSGHTCPGPCGLALPPPWLDWARAGWGGAPVRGREGSPQPLSGDPLGRAPLPPLVPGCPPSRGCPGGRGDPGIEQRQPARLRPRSDPEEAVSPPQVRPALYLQAGESMVPLLSFDPWWTLEGRRTEEQEQRGRALGRGVQGRGRQHLPQVPGWLGPGCLVTPADLQDPRVPSVQVARAPPRSTGVGGAEKHGAPPAAPAPEASRPRRGTGSDPGLTLHGPAQSPDPRLGNSLPNLEATGTPARLKPLDLQLKKNRKKERLLSNNR